MSSLKIDITGTDTLHKAPAPVKWIILYCALAKDPGYIDAVLAICKEQGIQVIFPGSEPELMVFSRSRKRIADAKGSFFPINTEEVIDTCLDKFKTNRFLSENGFAFPKKFPHYTVGRCSAGGFLSCNYQTKYRRQWFKRGDDCTE